MKNILHTLCILFSARHSTEVVRNYKIIQCSLSLPYNISSSLNFSSRLTNKIFIFALSYLSTLKYWKISSEKLQFSFIRKNGLNASKVDLILKKTLASENLSPFNSLSRKRKCRSFSFSVKNKYFINFSLHIIDFMCDDYLIHNTHCFKKYFFGASRFPQ